MNCEKLKFTNHAVEFMAKRGISDAEVQLVINKGEEIESYPSDRPYPSKLMFAYIQGRPIHIVLAWDEETSTCFVVTAYEPNTEKFEEDFKTRRKK